MDYGQNCPAKVKFKAADRKSLTSRPGPSLSPDPVCDPEHLPRMAHPRERREFTFFMPQSLLKFWTKREGRFLLSL